MKLTDPIWLQNPEHYNSLINESRKTILHPKLAELVSDVENSRILEYGCGDGNLIKLLNTNNEISIYDISEKAVSIAEMRLKDLNLKVYRKKSDIPIKYFDIVFFSLVLMTIGSEEVIEKTFNHIGEILKKCGTCIVAITHPCFRQYKFSTFHTSYLDKKKFNYLKEGDKFGVILKDLDTKKVVSFFDYHWSLSFTINNIVEANLNIKRMIELPDFARKKDYFNKCYCPYLIIICEKN